MVCFTTIIFPLQNTPLSSLSSLVFPCAVLLLCRLSFLVELHGYGELSGYGDGFFVPSSFSICSPKPSLSLPLILPCRHFPFQSSVLSSFPSSDQPPFPQNSPFPAHFPTWVACKSLPQLPSRVPIFSRPILPVRLETLAETEGSRCLYRR